MKTRIYAVKGLILSSAIIFMLEKMNCRNIALSDYKTCRNIDLFVGLSTCRTKDLSDYWPVGI